MINNTSNIERMEFFTKHVSTQTPHNHPLKQDCEIFSKALVYIGLEGIWIVSIGVKEKPSD